MSAILAMAAFVGAGAPAPASTPAAAPAAKSGAPAKVKSVTLAMRHRVYATFNDVQAVPLQKEFFIGDSEYSARVIRYVPDFAMELKSGKVISRSNQPKNPAFEIVVREKNVPQDTSWAFMNMPPHFGRKSMLAFKIVRIDFVGAPPVVADTTKAAAPAAHPPAASGKPGVSPINSHSGETR
ncbi:MAG TPA: hypothetical protein VFS09_06130 [Candidatus Eisenbacteria bacterium]|nr:hypothetical protein [Candidatus Eisenbacteria bacterium]